MNENIWQTEDGRLLKDLRASAGLDVHEFARAASISAAQLRQLEEGGNELFYSQSIKFQLGRKLLRKLGADVVRVVEEPMADTPSLFGFEPSSVNAPSLEETLSAAPAPVLTPPEVPATPWNKTWVPALAGVGVLAIAGVFGSQLLTANSAPQRQAASPSPPAKSLDATVTAAAAPVPSAMSSTPPPEIAPAAPLPVPAPTATAAPAQATLSDASGCRWDSGPGNSFMPRGMEKPSTYVHFVANGDASICIQDRSKKITQVNLKAGEKITVRGAAPWRIQTTQWANLGVFFQGYRMPVPATASLVTLNPRLEPLSEASTQTN